MTGDEQSNILRAHENGCLAGDGPFTKLCHDWLCSVTGVKTSLLTHSCTAALEMAALLIDVEEGDEIILPSYTFVSTANAFVLRGATPVFVDIRPDTLNIDEAKIEQAITSRTKAIIPVHYAGVGCEMDVILDLAAESKITVIEDAAQGVLSKYRGRELGSIGQLGTYSFHETKNVISGEGGALIVASDEMSDRAEIIREKGTDRSRFFRGMVDKYTWQDIGSSFLPGELIAAFLWAQLEHANEITSQRLKLWNNYHCILESQEESGFLRRPIVPKHCDHNAHMYYVLLPSDIDRAKVLADMERDGVNAVFHYIPLHSSPAGQRYGRFDMNMSVTDSVAASLIRLPLWIGLTESQQLRVCESLASAIQKQRG